MISFGILVSYLAGLLLGVIATISYYLRKNADLENSFIAAVQSLRDHDPDRLLVASSLHAVIFKDGTVDLDCVSTEDRWGVTKRWEASVLATGSRTSFIDEPGR